jgi:hypothetical protein
MAIQVPKAMGVTSCQKKKQQLNFKEFVMPIHVMATIDMGVATLQKITIIEDQNTMAIFIVPILNLFRKRSRSTWYFKENKKVENILMKLQATTTIQTNIIALPRKFQN